MSNPYTSVSISGYNNNPPSDDGAVNAANRVDWSKHKTKLGDPIKTLAESINSNVSTAFGLIFGQQNYEGEPTAWSPPIEARYRGHGIGDDYADRRRDRWRRVPAVHFQQRRVRQRHGRRRYFGDDQRQHDRHPGAGRRSDHYLRRRGVDRRYSRNQCVASGHRRACGHR